MNKDLLEPTIDSGERTRRSTPLFLKEGWALYKGGDYYMGILAGKEVKLRKRHFNFIGVKPDAPEWAHEEYAEWISH